MLHLIAQCSVFSTKLLYQVEEYLASAVGLVKEAGQMVVEAMERQSNQEVGEQEQ